MCHEAVQSLTGNPVYLHTYNAHVYCTCILHKVRLSQPCHMLYVGIAENEAVK